MCQSLAGRSRRSNGRERADITLRPRGLRLAAGERTRHRVHLANDSNLEEIVKWVVLAVLLIGIAMAMNALFPPICDHIAMGLAAGLLLILIYGAQSLRD